MASDFVMVNGRKEWVISRFGDWAVTSDDTPDQTAHGKRCRVLHEPSGRLTSMWRLSVFEALICAQEYRAAFDGVDPTSVDVSRGLEVRASVEGAAQRRLDSIYEAFPEATEDGEE